MTLVPPSKLFKGHCPECGPDRLSDVVGYHHRRSDSDIFGFWTDTEYRILQCRGCEAVYFQTDGVSSENEGHTITYWPAPSKKAKPDWSYQLRRVDGDLASLFDDIYVGLNNDLRVLSAIGVRTAFERASELLGVDPAKRFAEKLCELVKLGKIGADERITLDILTDAGSAAAHRGWKPRPQELDTMMNIIEAFLYRAFILDAEAKRLKGNVPEKQKRQKL